MDELTEPRRRELLAEVERLVEFAMPPVDMMAIDQGVPGLEALPRGQRHAVIVRAALTVLLAHGVIEARPQESWPFFWPTRIPRELLPSPLQ